MPKEELAKKHCVPCEGGTPPLSKNKSEEFLNEISSEEGWTLVVPTPEGRDPDRSGGKNSLEKTYSFKDFKEALNFINKVAEIAETEGHHPDISLHNYKKVTIHLSTHAIGGLSENDFILASKIDQILR